MNRLGRYKLGALLGEGGSGHVYAALRIDPGGRETPIALKVLRRNNDEIRREARIGGLLRHQNLVDVYEVGEEDGQWFCAMELCPGGSLLKYLPLPPRAVVEVGLQVCAALQYAHEALSLVHLDIKPANLLLSDGLIKVADLGIAQADGFARQERVRGTPIYMAPEQTQGFQVDSRADVYALGKTLVTLATGALPDISLGSPSWMHDETLGVNQTLAPEMVGGDVDDAVGELGMPNVPPWLLPVVGRCLMSAPEDRWQSMAELADALRSLEVTGAGLQEVVSTPAAERDPRQATNIHEQDNDFVGRSAERVQLAEGLASPGLRTLVGPAGFGKSRLARWAALQWHRQGNGQSWFCDLAEVDTLEGLLQAVAGTLSVPMHAADTEANRALLGHALAGRGPTVLILDNFEQILHLRHVVEGWLQQAVEVRFLVTSRQPLGLAEEAVVKLGPLDIDAASTLLITRGRERGVDLTEDPLLLPLARRLEGVPLALELAAGRLGVLSSQEVLERLSLSFLRQASSGRHATLQAALDGSWDLLSVTERAVLAQLSVFVGGFRVEDASVVLGLPSTTVRALLTTLLERAMLRLDAGQRIRMLVSVQMYAEHKLDDPRETRIRHSRCFAQYGSEEALGQLERHGGVLVRRALFQEVDNLTAAVRHALAHDLPETAAGAFLACWSVMSMQGPYDVANELGHLLLRQSGLSSATRGRIMHATAQVQHSLGLYNSAQTLLEAARKRFQELGLEKAEARLLCDLGLNYSSQGMMEAAEAALEAARAMAQAQGERVTVGISLTRMGSVRVLQGLYEDAIEMFDAALSIHQLVGNRILEAETLDSLASVRRHQGHIVEAQELLLTAQRIHQEVGNRLAVGSNNRYLGILYYDQCDLERAQWHIEQALCTARELGSRRDEGSVLGVLGNIYIDRGELDEAQAHYEAALRIHYELKNLGTCTIVLINLGFLHMQRGEHSEAQDRLERSLALSRRRGLRVWEGVAIGNLGNLSRIQGDLPAAEQMLSEALRIHQDAGFSHGQSYWLTGLALVRLEQGRLDESMEHSQQAVTISAPYPGLRARACIMQALILLERGELTAAKRSLQEAEGPHIIGFVGALFAVVSALVATAGQDRGGADAALARARENKAFCTPGSELAMLIERAARQLQQLSR